MLGGVWLDWHAKMPTNQVSMAHRCLRDWHWQIVNFGCGTWSTCAGVVSNHACLQTFFCTWCTPTWDWTWSIETIILRLLNFVAKRWVCHGQLLICSHLNCPIKSTEGQLVKQKCQQQLCRMSNQTMPLPNDEFVMGNCTFVHSRFCNSAMTEQSLAVAWFGWTFCTVVVRISVWLVGLMWI